MSLAITKSLVQSILQNPQHHAWSVQGFGMMRCYLPNDVRFHIWHSALKVPRVSLIHDHPWDFRSEIIVGELRNVRYRVRPDGTGYMVRTIKSGVGLKVIDEDTPCGLVNGTIERYVPGSIYEQTKDEVHATGATDGTVTLVQRVRGPVDVARVFYAHDGEWVSAEPRPATVLEIHAITEYTLEKYFK